MILEKSATFGVQSIYGVQYIHHQNNSILYINTAVNAKTSDFSQVFALPPLLLLA